MGIFLGVSHLVTLLTSIARAREERLIPAKLSKALKPYEAWTQYVYSVGSFKHLKR